MWASKCVDMYETCSCGPWVKHLLICFTRTALLGRELRSLAWFAAGVGVFGILLEANNWRISRLLLRRDWFQSGSILERDL